VVAVKKRIHHEDMEIREGDAEKKLPVVALMKTVPTLE
jgi:hypothetical protein